MRIVICDDNKDIIHALEVRILGYFKNNKMETPNISKYESVEAMLHEEETYDLAFLDVEMPGLSGIASIKELRKRNNGVLVFIITSHDTSYLDDAMEEGIYRYMMKPLNPLQLQVNLDAAIRRIGSLNKKITVETDKGVVSFNTDEIILVYTERRKTMVKTADETYKTSQSFLFWENTLPVFSFAQSHKGIIINLKYVRRVGDDLIEFTTSDEPAYLSVRNRTLFKKKFLQFMNSMD